METLKSLIGKGLIKLFDFGFEETCRYAPICAHVDRLFLTCDSWGTLKIG